MGRPTKANSLSHQDVISAAIACIDAEGSPALNVSRVARQLGIKPPAIYKHVPDGNAGLHRAVALVLWQQYMAYCHQRVDGIENDRDRLLTGWRITRQFAQQYPYRYQVMTTFVLQPDDAAAAAIIAETQQFLAEALQMYGLSHAKLIDAMRMMTATLNGYIAIEQRGNLTLDRSTDESFEVLLDALLVAVEYIRDA